MSLSRRLTVTAAMLALALATAGAAAHATRPAAPDGGVTPMVAGFLNCESISARILCDVTPTAPVGGTLTIDWIINGVARPSLRNQTSINIGCTVGNIVGVVAVLSDDCGPDRLTTSELCRVVGQ